jgi:predicted ATP-binding protein involved in virulence
VRLQKLHAMDLRGFENLALRFGPNLAILVGVNGSGKTTVLDSLAVLLSQVPAVLDSRGGHGRRLSDADVRLGAGHVRAEVDVSFGPNLSSWAITYTRRGLSPQSSSSLALLRESLAPVQQQLAERVLRETEQQPSKTKASSPRELPPLQLPLAVYYPVNRAVLDIPVRLRERHEFASLSAYEGALSGGGANFRRFFEWFRNEEDLENETRLEGDSAWEDRGLRAVRKAIEGLLPGFKNPHVRRKPGRLVVTKGQVGFEVNQLSDGEKCLLALAGDLARRLALANTGPSDPLEAEAVVLIDEVELHLHPGWQRRVIGALRRTFPNCQFIVTTHSPQVLASVPTEAVILLKDWAAFPSPAPTRGRDSNAILSEVMEDDERPPEASQEINRIASLIDAGQYDQARSALEDLARAVSRHDSAVVRLRSLLGFLEGGI